MVSKDSSLITESHTYSAGIGWQDGHTEHDSNSTPCPSPRPRSDTLCAAQGAVCGLQSVYPSPLHACRLRCSPGLVQAANQRGRKTCRRRW